MASSHIYTQYYSKANSKLDIYITTLLETTHPIITITVSNSNSNTMLSLHEHLRSESQRWAAQQRQQFQNYPAPPSESYEDSIDSRSDSDSASIFSTRSRRSSVSSVVSDEDLAPAVAFDQPRDLNGAPITMYTSLEQAVTQSTQRAEALGPPRRVVTPGKLYENEEDDDEIVEVGEDTHETLGSAVTLHREGGFNASLAHTVASRGIAVG